METSNILERHQKVGAFIVSALLILWLHQAKGIVDFLYDSSVYWNLSKTAFITNFPDIVRGYVYPLFVWPFHGLGDVLGYPYLAFRAASSIAFAYLLTGPVPEFFLGVLGGKLSLRRRLAFVLALGATYPGLFLYPLSDLPAVLLVVISLSCAVRTTSGPYRWWLALASGAAAYAAYNTRTIYLFSFIALLLVLALVIHRGKAVRERAMIVLCFLLGSAAMATPQMFINHRHHDTFSPAVLANIQGKPLMAQQLFWGVTVQRYETSIDPNAPAPSFVYKDPAGIVLRNLHPEAFEEASFKSYIGLVSQHPIQFLGIYGRHLVNGMDVRDGMTYARHDSRDRNGVALACVGVLFCSLVILFSRRRRWDELVLLSPVWLPVVAIMPGAVETRFFVPVYLTLYAAAVTQFEVDVVERVIRRHWLVLTVGFAAAASFSLAITSSTMASLVYSLP